ncbi:hypothetical protein LZC95_03520 [Pendulispora brunnea]|uniref:Uncharacterized protein n=1 Tax=Pendulispora brunnea TaxID=2905690 RepID=A0ABZ2KB58_9BACT
MSSRKIIAGLFFVAMAIGCASSPSEDPAPPARGPESAAAAAIRTLRHVTENQRRAAQDTTPSASHLDGASLGDGVPVRRVRLDALRAYRTTDDPRALLVDHGAFLYPITVGDEVRSSVVMVQRQGRWVPSSFGRVGLARALHANRQQLDARHAKAVVLVEVPALQARFMGHEGDDGLHLTPLQDVEGTPLRAGKSEKAAVVMAALVPLAARIDDSAPPR